MRPSPWHASQRPPLTLKENRPGAYPSLCLGKPGEPFADRGEGPCVGGRVRPRGPADWRLVDIDDLVEKLGAVDGLVRCRHLARLVKTARKAFPQRLQDQGRLAAARDAGHAGQHAKREIDGHVTQIVAAGILDPYEASLLRLAAGRDADFERARQMLLSRTCWQ